MRCPECDGNNKVVVLVLKGEVDAVESESYAVDDSRTEIIVSATYRCPECKSEFEFENSFEVPGNAPLKQFKEGKLVRMTT